jgi:hypothetical protein
MKKRHKEIYKSSVCNCDYRSKYLMIVSFLRVL